MTPGRTRKGWMETPAPSRAVGEEEGVDRRLVVEEDAEVDVRPRGFKPWLPVRGTSDHGTADPVATRGYGGALDRSTCSLFTVRILSAALPGLATRLEGRDWPSLPVDVHLPGLGESRAFLVSMWLDPPSACAFMDSGSLLSLQCLTSASACAFMDLEAWALQVDVSVATRLLATRLLLLLGNVDCKGRSYCSSRSPEGSRP